MIYSVNVTKYMPVIGKDDISDLKNALLRKSSYK